MRTEKCLTQRRKREAPATDVDREECGGNGTIMEAEKGLVHTRRREEITTTTERGERRVKEDEIRTRSDTYEETRRVSEKKQPEERRGKRQNQ